MAKDPAFLFYPGDASEDTQFMNRLERGCYFDLLKAQKKFNKFSLDQIKKVLGRDFDTCWPSIELVLKCENGFYYIEWANDAIEKRAKHLTHQSENGKKGGRPAKTSKEENPNESQNNPTLLNGFINEKPLENENENEKVFVNDEGVGEEKTFKTFPGEESLPLDLPTLKVGAVKELMKITKNISLSTEQVVSFWEVFKNQNFTGKKYYADVGGVTSHFINWMKTQNVTNGTSSNKTNGSRANGRGEAAAVSAIEELNRRINMV